VGTGTYSDARLGAAYGHAGSKGAARQGSSRSKPCLKTFSQVIDACAVARYVCAGEEFFVQALIRWTWPVTARLRVREADGDQGQRPLRITRWSTGSVMTCRLAHVVLL
jgi:hypothetical protein